MIPRRAIQVALVVSGLAVQCASQAQEISKTPPPRAEKVITSAAPQKWEYADEFMCRTANANNYPTQIQARLGQYGAAGWELVSLTDFQGPRDPQYTHCYFAVFKRPATS